MVKFKELKDLQEIDSKTDSLEGKRASLPQAQEIEALQAEQSQMVLEQSGLEAELRGEELRQKKMEGELDLTTQKIKKEEGKLYSGTIANPKELSSIQEEIKSLKRQMDEEETGLLEELEVIESLRGRLKDTRARLADNSDQLAKLQAEFARLVAEIEGEVAQLRESREKIVPLISPETLELYERLRKEKQGVAVVELRDGVCQGCRMELPAEEVDKMLHSDELWQCDNCRRILIR